MSNEINLEESVYDKSQVCPVCSSSFKSKAIRKGKTRFVELDLGLRNIYSPIMLDYYGVIICDECGYAAVEKTFNELTAKEIRIIKEKVNKDYVPRKYPIVYDAEIAIERLKKALYFAYIKEGASSEKGYICYKIANIAGDLHNESLQKEYFEQAYKWYQDAYINEQFPMMDMGEEQILYITSYICYKTDRKDQARKILGELMVKKTLPAILKEKVYELVELIKEQE